MGAFNFRKKLIANHLSRPLVSCIHWYVSLVLRVVCAVYLFGVLTMTTLALALVDT